MRFLLRRLPFVKAFPQSPCCRPPPIRTWEACGGSTSTSRSSRPTALRPSRRTIFQYFWRPKPVSPPPPASGNKEHGPPSSNLPPTPHAHHDLYDKQTLWGAKTGVGSKMPFPLQATESLLEKLEKAQLCTEHLLHNINHHRHYTSSSTSSSSAPHATLSSTSPLLDELVDEHWKFRLERRPSTLPQAGLGLFLTRGLIKAGDVITCYPGLVYRIPYDLESCMPMDEVGFTPCPPSFLLKNDYLLRFHHAETDQHLLLDGCPRGISALNFISANQRRGRPWANMEWLESNSHACGRRGLPHAHVYLAEGGREGGGGGRGRDGGLVETEVCVGEGGEYVMVPTVFDTSKYFTHKLGLGNMTRTPFGPRQRREGITWRRDQPFFTDAPGHGVDGKKQDGHHEQKQEQEGGGDEDTHQHRLNDPRAPGSYNSEFHLCEIPRDLPPHLLRFVPNLHFSDSLGDRRFCVLVTAATDLEVPVGGAPIELFVPYASPFGGVCKHGFPLL